MNAVRKRRLRIVVLLTVAMGGPWVSLPGWADEPAVESVRRAAAPAPLLRPARPYWLELTIAQRQALAPLAEDWERLDVQTKKKWVEIAKRYPKMQADEQGRSQERMREWARLTPEQRRVARDSFARIRTMPPEQRAEMLRKYRELPPEKRQALTSEGQASKALVVPKVMPAPVARRTQIREGAKDHNPAVAAQKSASPIVAPARVAGSPAAANKTGNQTDAIAPAMASPALPASSTPPAATAPAAAVPGGATPSAAVPVAAPAAVPPAVKPAS